MRLGKMQLLLMIFFVSATAFAEDGYNIRLILKPYTNSQVYLAYYYGKVKAIADSAVLDANSSAVFKGKEKLPGGIYFVVSPKKEILFEVLIDKQQNFSITGDTANLSQNLTSDASPAWDVGWWWHNRFRRRHPNSADIPGRYVRKFQLRS